MLLHIDSRLPKVVVQDLVQRAAKFQCFKAIVYDAAYKSDRVTENEWKNDFKLPPHMKIGSLEKYNWQPAGKKFEST